MDALDYNSDSVKGYKVGFVYYQENCGAQEGGRLKIEVDEQKRVKLSYADANGVNNSVLAKSWNSTYDVTCDEEHHIIKGNIRVYTADGIQYVVRSFLITMDRRWPLELRYKRIHVYVGKKPDMGGNSPEDGSFTGDDR